MKFKLSIIAFLLFFISGCESNDENMTKTSAMAEAKSNVIAQNSQTNAETKSENKEQEKPQADNANYDAPFELTSIDEQKFKMQKFDKGFKMEGNDQAILFNFFATWCPPCKAEIPHLNNLQDKFKGKLKVISILMEDKTKEEIEAFIKRYKIKFDVTYGESNFFFAKSMGGVIGIPYMVLYKPNGEYAAHYVGLVPEEMLENDINKVIN